MIDLRRAISPIYHYLYFYWFCYKYKLRLSYTDNRDGIHILREVFSKKVYVPHFPFGRAAVIVDIGAHFGYFSIFASYFADRNSKLYALEPSKENFRIAMENFRQNGINISFFNTAMAGSSEERELNLSEPQNHSLYANYLPNMTNAEVVNSISLDDFCEKHKIEKIDFLKLDCEGSEYEILLNASSGTLSKIDVISMEMHEMRHCGYEPSTLDTFLNKSGFNLQNSIDVRILKDNFNVKVEYVRRKI